MQLELRKIFRIYDHTSYSCNSHHFERNQKQRAIQIEMTCDRKIKIQSCNGQFFIWNIDDVKHIRKFHKVVGSFVGSANWIGMMYQNRLHGPPLQLLNEECLYLLSKCSQARLVKQIGLHDQSVIEKCAEEYKKYETSFENDYQKVYHEHSVEQIKSMSKKKWDSIVKGKAAKLGIPIDQINEDKLLEEMLSRVKPANSPMKQLLIPSPWQLTFSEIECNLIKNGFEDLENQNDLPILKNEHSLLRYLVYKDLNDKGLHLTKGNKFGSDFLAYPTDPLFCHAEYMVICLSENQKLSKTLLNTYTRLGSQVNKNVLLAKFKDEMNDENQANDTSISRPIEYMAIKWQSNIRDCV